MGVRRALGARPAAAPEAGEGGEPAGPAGRGGARRDRRGVSGAPEQPGDPKSRRGGRGRDRWRDEAAGAGLCRGRDDPLCGGRAGVPLGAAPRRPLSTVRG